MRKTYKVLRCRPISQWAWSDRPIWYSISVISLASRHEWCVVCMRVVYATNVAEMQPIALHRTGPDRPVAPAYDLNRLAISCICILSDCTLVVRNRRCESQQICFVSVWENHSKVCIEKIVVARAVLFLVVRFWLRSAEYYFFLFTIAANISQHWSILWKNSSNFIHYHIHLYSILVCGLVSTDVYLLCDNLRLRSVSDKVSQKNVQLEQ